MKESKGYYGNEQSTKYSSTSFVATFAPAAATDVAINERNENLRKLFATKRKAKSCEKSNSYTNLPHVSDVNVAALTTIEPQKGQTSNSSWHMANDARSDQTVANYGNTLVAIPNVDCRIRRWSVNRCENVDNNVQPTSLASNRSAFNIGNGYSNVYNNDYYIDDDDIASGVGKSFDGTVVADEIVDIDLFATRNQQCSSSYELATLRFDNTCLSKNKLFESEHSLPITEPCGPRYMETDEDFDISQENLDMPHSFIGNSYDAVETCSPNDYFSYEEYPQEIYEASQHVAYDQLSMQHGKICENLKRQVNQQQIQASVNVNSMSELMKIRLERQVGKSLRQKYQQSQQQQESESKLQYKTLQIKDQLQQLRHRGSHDSSKMFETESTVARIPVQKISSISTVKKNGVLGKFMKNHIVGTEQLLSNINLNTPLHSADIWRDTDEINGNLYTNNTCPLNVRHIDDGRIGLISIDQELENVR